jgi:hypothetical protein
MVGKRTITLKGHTMEEQKVQLQILNIQLQTLAQLECVKKFLELNEKAEMLASLIKKEEAPSE